MNAGQSTNRCAFLASNDSFTIIYLFCTYLLCVYTQARAISQVCRLEDNFWESVLTYHVGPADRKLRLSDLTGSTFTY